MRIKCIVLACFVLVFAGAMSSQTQFSAKIPANTIHVPVTLANPVYYNETITAVGVSTPSGALNCSGLYPQISFRYKRGGVDNALGYVVTSAGNSWTQPPVATPLQPGDQVTAFLNDAGVGCTNELPLTVYFITQYTATVDANLTNLASGASGTNAFIRFRLPNCRTANPQITGTSVLLAYQQDFRADVTGHARGIIYGNDKITCGGAQPTVYEVSYYVNQVREGVPKQYYVCTLWPGGGCSNSDLTFDPSTATSIDPLPPPGERRRQLSLCRARDAIHRAHADGSGLKPWCESAPSLHPTTGSELGVSLKTEPAELAPSLLVVP